MAKVMIRTDTEPPDEFRAAFSHLTVRTDTASATLTGEVGDMHELRVVLKTLDMLGLHVTEVLTDPRG